MSAGTTVGSYRILRQLGAGGMGEVYLAEDSRLSRRVALKFLPPGFVGDAERMRRFMREAKAASALNHPNIITVYEVGETPTAFIATEFIDGQSLRQRLRAGAIPLPEALDIAVQLAGAIAAAHDAGIIHRDIKPDNVMLRPDGYVKLLDFGIAKIASPSATADEETTHMATEAGELLGTLSYMSPEQARGLAIDHRTDIFAMGALIYEIVTGKSAFGGDTPGDRLASLLTSDPPPVSATVGDVPPLLDATVRKALRKSKDERYTSAKELLIDLKAIRRDLESAVAPPRAKPSAATWVVAAVVALVGILTVAPRFTGGPPQPSTPTAAPATPPVALSYWITVQKYRNGKPFEDPFRLAQAINFEKDYRIRLHFDSSRPGFLYLVSEGPGGTPGDSPYNLIAATPIEGGQVKQVPQDSWFQFDDQKGSERVWIVWAGSKVPELESGIPFMNTTDRGTIRDAAISRGVSAFLASHAASPPQIEKDDRTQQTRLRTGHVPFVYLLTLEHH
jgi:serine/threonine protein kinase